MGECCKSITFTVDQIRTDRLLREYYKAHGCTIKDNKIHVPMRCPHLTENNLCDIHDTKPIMCKMYRGQKSDRFTMPEECRYGE